MGDRNASLVKQHRCGDITDDEYFDKVVAANADYDLPYNAQEDVSD